MDCDITKVLLECYEECAFSIRGNDYLTLKWNERNTFSKPTLEEIQSKWNDELIYKLQLDKLREERDTALIKTDKYTVPDWPHSTPEVRQAWLDYRQALRDLPDVTEDPANPIWPVAPQ